MYDYVGPEWLHEVRFDFAAKVPPETSEDDFGKMLQNLLTERFKLAVHRETRQMSIYELTVAANGPKFGIATSKNRADDGSKPEDPLQSDAEGFPILRPGTTMAVNRGRGRARSQNEPISWFVQFLSAQMGQPVVDATGLTGRYDFVLSWTFEPVAPDSHDGLLAATSAKDLYRTSLIEAARSQLGLRLQQKKGPVEVLVIDHIEKTPTEN